MANQEHAENGGGVVPVGGPPSSPVSPASSDDAAAPSPPSAPAADFVPVRTTPANSGAPANSADDTQWFTFGELLSQRSSPGGAFPQPEHRVLRRRVVLPVVLLLMTALATFWVGCCQFAPFWPFDGSLFSADSPISMAARRVILQNWSDGLIYMVCVIAILFCHEMGHYVGTLIYRVPATLPFFIPFPMTPMGTMGAVISMDGMSADRKQIFDIGIAGPIAGLVIAIPVAWYGVQTMDLAALQQHPVEHERGGIVFELPIAMQWMAEAIHQDDENFRPGTAAVHTRHMNPYLMAGWFGMLITGLNMMPVSQLDGGHVIYGLFGRASRIFARTFLFLAILFIATQYERAWVWAVMLLLVILIGVDHPPTANDRVRLGPVRTMLGLASLLIPVLCFPVYGLRPLGM